MSGLDLQDAELVRSRCYVDGAWIAAANGASFAVTNPATGAVLGSVPDLGAVEARSAIAAADAAFAPWSRRPAAERGAILRRWSELVLASKRDLARLLTLEQGKPQSEALGEIEYGASYLEWFAEEARRVYGETIPAPAADRRIVVLKQPVGVCAAITPWNFPNAMLLRKVGPALAAGCTLVAKPAEQTPLSALALAALGERAGVPPGVFNVVTGDARTLGAELCSDARVRKLSFTGSTEVGKTLMRQCADTLKRLSLELGGNAPFIVFDDADLAAAADGALVSKFRNAGQTCVCANRLLVQRSVLPEFSALLAARVARLRVGNGLDPGVTVGPLIDDAALAKVREHVSDALTRGARLVHGGSAVPRRAGIESDLYFEPTVLTGATREMLLAREETFGPVAPLFAFDDEAEAIALANDTPSGLAAYFYGRDLRRVWRVAEALEFGMVGVNTGLISTAVAPFGGVKESGFGREGSHHGIAEYLSLKYVCLAGLD